MRLAIMGGVCAVTIMGLLSGLPAAAQKIKSSDELAKEFNLPPNPSGRGGFNPNPVAALPGAKPGQVTRVSMTSRPASPAASRPVACPQANTLANAQGQGAADLEIQFATGSAAFTDAAAAQLTALSDAVRDRGVALRVEGHTDTVGNPQLNQSLSERRARAVRNYLISHANLVPCRVVAVGKGQSELKVPTPDNTPEPQNRRVHIVNLGSE